MKKLKILVSVVGMFTVFSLTNVNAMEKKENKKTEFNAEKDLFENNLNEYKKEDKKEEIFDEIDTSSKSKKNEESSEKKETENILTAPEQIVRKEYRSVIPGDVEITGFEQGKEFKSPNAEIDFIFDFKKTELDLVEEGGIGYDAGAYSFAKLIREVALIFGLVPPTWFNKTGRADEEADISKTLKRLQKHKKRNFLTSSPRKKFRFKKIQMLSPVLAKYIKYQMDKYEELYGEDAVNDGEYLLLKDIRKFILLSDPSSFEFAISDDWEKYTKTGNFDGEFEGRFVFKLRDDLKDGKKTSKAKQELLGGIKSDFENRIKLYGKNFRQTIAYRVLFAFFYVVMRENLNLSIDKHFKINRNKYFKQMKNELMKEMPMSYDRHKKLLNMIKTDRKNRHSKLPKVLCCVDIDPKLYGFDSDFKIEKEDDPFEWLEWFKQGEENEESEENGDIEGIEDNSVNTRISDVDLDYQVGNEGDIAKKHMELNTGRIIKKASRKVKYNGTPEDFKLFYETANWILTKEPVQKKFEYFNDLFDPMHIESISFSEDGLKIILKFKDVAYERNIFKILDFNNFVHAPNNVIGVGKTSSYAERIAKIVLLYKKLCEKKKEYDLKSEELKRALSKYQDNMIIVGEIENWFENEKSEDEKEVEDKYKKEESEDEKEVENKYKKEESEDEKEVKDKENAKIYKAMQKRWINFNNSVNVEKNKNKENFKMEEDEKGEELGEIDTSSNKK